MNEELKPGEMTFEQALLALEDTVERLNENQMDLDKMIVLYEEGLHYLKLCQEELAKAELKVKLLNEKMGITPGDDENG
ncbi:MAG TPA: exodeoxyribonuclease VII small subunit [Candidatus Cloacimonadota bacterium]|mgnify:FL=1|jgi:exodeoxyribonuclease VII small subunit|nr:exodeoxyribonuclease VII small subunit [Candidatus Cloacimonadota bacterium]HOG30611.1 exodeoxyribonuclease VII small subunit [Candidatus Cloacimonadota bacterium]HOR58809.1 exodeoxyribonuclease VII small subunit [Candidatus Cloacimonadota bacterium]HPB08273.1 exodeoxyribonuclease VII small subunit [Candidatus Cloacimonadota bacterium]HPL23534.1 exodeoxyribonuclease VII small subunit [Candidatus Cloacimonadota bacterium]